MGDSHSRNSEDREVAAHPAGKHDADLRPWRRARSLDKIFVYWIPATFPIRSAEREWLMTFLDRLIELQNRQHGLCPDVFLRAGFLDPDGAKAFVERSREFLPLPGICRYLQMGSAGRMQAGEKGSWPQSAAVEFDGVTVQSCHWFVDRSEKKLRESFFGFGGMTITLRQEQNVQAQVPMKSAPRLPATACMEGIDLHRMVQNIQYLAARPLNPTRELFAFDLKSDPKYPGTLFVLPLLRAEHFFDLAPDQLERVFRFYQVYIAESVSDHGLLMASMSSNFEEDLVAILRTLQEEGREYPGGRG